MAKQAPKQEPMLKPRPKSEPKEKMKRENRYIVLKKTDIKKHLTDQMKFALTAITAVIKLHREKENKEPLQCVVVEHDWPEYEPTWQAIEKRVDGNKTRGLPEINQPFYFEKFNPCGGTYADPRLAMFFGHDEATGVRAMKYLDEEKGMEFINSAMVHIYAPVPKH